MFGHGVRFPEVGAECPVARILPQSLGVRSWPRVCQNPNYMPCRFDSARFKSTKSREIEPTCPKMHCTISASRVLTHPRPEAEALSGGAPEVHCGLVLPTETDTLGAA